MATCSENPNLVEVVLLGVPCGVVGVRAGRVSVRGHHDAHGQRRPRECVRGEILRLQAQLVGRGGHGGRGVHRLLCFLVRLRHHEAQLPEEVAMCSNYAKLTCPVGRSPSIALQTIHHCLSVSVVFSASYEMFDLVSGPAM